MFLTYRLPREPSAPRLALWRATRRLGALQLGDGLVALPHSTRNLEQVQWLAADIAEHGGSSSVWHARADRRRDHEAHVAALRESVAAEYRVVQDEAATAGAAQLSDSERRRLVRRLRGQLRQIGLRDHFDAPGRERARSAVDDLARPMESITA